MHRLDAWGRDDYSTFKPKKVKAEFTSEVAVEMQSVTVTEVIDGTVPFFR